MSNAGGRFSTEGTAREVPTVPTERQCALLDHIFQFGADNHLVYGRTLNGDWFRIANAYGAESRVVPIFADDVPVRFMGQVPAQIRKMLQ